jgi:hypothetical protein
MKRHGSWAVFFMSVTANPIHLPMTIAIAALRYPPYKFILFGFFGQLVKSLVLAFAGYYGLTSLINAVSATGSLVMTLLVIAGVILALAGWQLLVWLSETRDKNRKYQAARDSAEKSSKTLLIIGGPWGIKPARRWLKMPAHGEGDVCLDIDHRALEGHPCAVIASVTHIPFADRTFGAIFISHVLEHLTTTADAKQALEEMNRVADSVHIVCPSRQSIAGWIIRGHHIWVWQEGDRTYLKQRGKVGNRERIIVETAHKNI